MALTPCEYKFLSRFAIYGTLYKFKSVVIVLTPIRRCDLASILTIEFRSKSYRQFDALSRRRYHVVMHDANTSSLCGQ